MSIIGNILWIVLGGIIIFLEYILGGLALCLTVVGIPFGFQCFKLSILALFPFGKKVISGNASTGFLATVMNIIWIICGGIWIAVTHLGLALLLFITIIGIPFARQHLKLAALAFTPFGKEIV
ncbi:MAG TPA: YccF domain-containing protein [Bacillota bacterium]|nr:YccF domain-containing protein [Bacillota bacterium]